MRMRKRQKENQRRAQGQNRTWRMSLRKVVRSKGVGGWDCTCANARKQRRRDVRLVVLFALLILGCLLGVVPRATALHKSIAKPIEMCDVTRGQWRYSGVRLPMYGINCPYIRPVFACGRNGRPDIRYPRYYWRPADCRLRWWTASGVRFLMRRRTLVFIGDSIMSNMYESFLCLLHAGGLQMTPIIRRFSNSSETRFTGFFLPQFSFTVLYRFSPYLMRARKGVNRVARQGGHGYTVDVDKVDPALLAVMPHADVIVMLSGTWWQQNVPGRVRSNIYLQNDKPLDKGVRDLEAYKRALKTLHNLYDDTNAAVIPYFVSSSPTHYISTRLALAGRGLCGSVVPLSHMMQQQLQINSTVENYYKVEKDVFGSESSAVRLVHITEMSIFRTDGHIGRWSAPLTSPVSVAASGSGAAGNAGSSNTGTSQADARLSSSTEVSMATFSSDAERRTSGIDGVDASDAFQASTNSGQPLIAGFEVLLGRGGRTATTRSRSSPDVGEVASSASSSSSSTAGAVASETGGAAAKPNGTAVALLSRPDCRHWCLPGVPDAWNQVLFNMWTQEPSLLKRKTSTKKSKSSQKQPKSKKGGSSSDKSEKGGKGNDKGDKDNQD